VVPQSSRGDRFTSYDVDAFEVPGGREEDWRFTPLKRLNGLHNGTAVAGGAAVVDVKESPEVRVERVARDDKRIGDGGVPADRVSAQAWSAFTQATVITFPKETKTTRPTVVTVTGPGEGGVAYGHVQLRAEAFAEAVVVVDYRGSGTYADNLEIVALDGSKLTVVVVHDWNDDAVHVGAHLVRLGRDAVLKHTVVTIGGSLVRASPTVTYGDKGGAANVGLWAVSPEAYAWLRGYLTVDRFKGLLTEAASLPVERYELPNLLALNFVVPGLLAPGVSGTTRPDAQAKGLGEYLRSRLVPVPVDLL